MLHDALKHHRLILASGSPRRQQFFKELGLDFEIRLKETEEIYPKQLTGGAISDYLAELKATAFDGTLNDNEILITSDTVVWHNSVSLAKAADHEEAYAMLRALSGDWHEVITSICFATTKGKTTVRNTTRVKFKELSETEIRFYVDTYQPFDKAGAYGIQEWLGHIAIEEIEGSYNSVMGLPTHLLYKTLTTMVN